MINGKVWSWIKSRNHGRIKSKMSQLEKIWTTEAGLVAICVFTSQSHYCGYVGVPFDHVSIGASASVKDSIKVHGGITFEGNVKSLSIKLAGEAYENLYWFGFDCAHYSDLTLNDIRFRLIGVPFRSGAEYRKQPYVEQQCELLAKQLMEMK